MATAGPTSPEVDLKRKKDETDEQYQNRLEKAAEFKEKQKEADSINASRTGKGTRVFVGMTRGKGSQVISYEAFDESQPETLPKDLDEFVKMAKVESNEVLISMLIDGFNAQSYSAASDPVSEYVNAAWPEDVQKNFKVAVRQLAAGANLSIEDAAGIIRPQIDKVHGK